MITDEQILDLLPRQRIEWICDALGITRRRVVDVADRAGRVIDSSGWTHLPGHTPDGRLIPVGGIPPPRRADDPPRHVLAPGKPIDQGLLASMCARIDAVPARTRRVQALKLAATQALRRLDAALTDQAARDATAHAKATTGSRPRKAPTSRPARVRAWALTQGYQLGDRGRISQAITKAYDNAHPGEDA